MKCTIHDVVVLSRPPEGPLAVGQQHLLLRLVGEIACWHLLTTFPPPGRMTSDFCRASSF